MGDTTCTPKLTRKKSLETVGSKSSMKWVSREKWFRTWPTRPGFIIKTDEWWREASGTAALQIYVVNRCQLMGLLPDTQNCGMRMRRECCERFFPPPQVSDPDMHHGTCVTHVPWRMPESLTSCFVWSRWWGKRSQYSRRMRNPQFCVSGKRPMLSGYSAHSYTIPQIHYSCQSHFHFNCSVQGILQSNP